VLWSNILAPEVVDLSLLFVFIDEMRWFLVQGSTGMSLVDVPYRHVPRYLQSACLLTYKASLVMMFLWI
jgi:hypothetical protein